MARATELCCAACRIGLVAYRRPRRMLWLFALFALFALFVLGWPLAGSVFTAARAAPAYLPMPEAGIPEFKADYALRRNNLHAASLTRFLRCVDSVCRLESEGGTSGMLDLLLRGRIHEWTEFRLTADAQIIPQGYYYRQQARGDNDEHVRLFFNPVPGESLLRVVNRGDERWERQVNEDTMDELLSQFRLMMAVRAGHRSMSFTVVRGDGDVRSYDFEVTATEVVETPAGSFEALRVDRLRGSESRRTTTWFAPALDYLPVIIRHERVGRETYTVELSSLPVAP
jgi:hypothetical protein